LNVSALALALAVNWSYLILTAVIILLGIVYSAGSHPWKNHPIAGFLANVIAHGLIVYAMGSVFAGQDLADTWLNAIPYALAVGGVFMATTVADIDGDRASGKHTPAVALGAQATMIVASLMVTAAVALALWLNASYLGIASICTLPAFARAAFSDFTIWAPRAAKIGVLALTIAAAVAYPAYLIVLAAGFFGTRLFFRWRFSMAYPSFL
jgi:1,4-dihydroxy-2-naphthoate octaprenyltransferase